MEMVGETNGFLQGIVLGPQLFVRHISYLELQVDGLFGLIGLLVTPKLEE